MAAIIAAMEVNEKLTLWGEMHSAARDAARAAGTADERTAEDKRREAQALRERADRLHREIYRELGSRPARG